VSVVGPESGSGDDDAGRPNEPTLSASTVAASFRVRRSPAAVAFFSRGGISKCAQRIVLRSPVGSALTFALDFRCMRRSGGS
jgi:hypothetical protein